MSNNVTPVFAALTTLCASTALSGVIDGGVWLGHAAVAIIVVVGTGIGLRALRFPILLIGLAQLFALMCLVVALFTSEGVLGFLPGPKAVGQIGDVLRDAVTVVQTGVPPVEPTTPILCLVVIAIGLVAVLVDSLAVAAGTPAASGLVLLCVYAVPASLADEMLPWWSFVLGAASYAMLLAVDGTHRHQQWRGRSPRPASTSGNAGAPVALVSVALVLALALGAIFTPIGTVGQLPGNVGAGGIASGGFSLKAFTRLRGMLDQKGNQEMFRVRGLSDDRRYLRATTLKTYKANEGWDLGPGMPNGRPLNTELPLEPGRSPGRENIRVEIEPVNSEDNWAPVYGSPRLIEGLPNDARFDELSGAVYTRKPRKFGTYVEWADLNQPTFEQLRQSPNASGSEVGPQYTELPPLDQRITALARDLTGGKANQWDKVLALKNYFAPENGFQYRTETARASTQDALVDFLFDGKVGYCEQYASAMAVLVRAAGIPARVAIGYTSGFQAGDYRSITTSDAHAWVEVFFPEYGWITVDPTPLNDGRGYTPPYMNPQTSGNPRLPADEPSSTSTSETTENSAVPQAPDNDPTQTDPGTTPQDDESSWAGYTSGALAGGATVLSLLLLTGLGVAGLGLTGASLTATKRRQRTILVTIASVLWLLAAVFAVAIVSWWLAVPLALIGLFLFPALTRYWRRRDRLQVVSGGTSEAPVAAWDELMAESWDRGASAPETDTIRMTARRLVREHSLDDEGKEGLRTVVSILERSWYGGGSAPGPELPTAVEHVRASMNRNAPLSFRAKFWPRSVMNPRKPRKKRSDDASGTTFEPASSTT